MGHNLVVNVPEWSSSYDWHRTAKRRVHSATLREVVAKTRACTLSLTPHCVGLGRMEHFKAEKKLKTAQQPHTYTLSLQYSIGT